MPLRFLITAPAPINAGTTLSINREQAHHVGRVLRKKAGDEIDCFDGEGLAFVATLTRIDSRGGEVTVDSVQTRSPPPQHRLHAALSLLKGTAMDRAVQQAVELGAAEITLLTTARTEVRLRDAKRADNKLRHWQKIIEGACEQSGALHVPTLHPPQTLREALRSAGNNALVFDASGEPLPQTLPGASRTLFIGPEGGWDPEEIAAFSAAGVPIYRLGGNVLRAETMPGVALALIQQAQGWTS